MPMKLKTIEVDVNGQKVVVALTQDGKPLYEAEDGKDVAHDADATLGTIRRLNGEAQGHREAKEAALTELKKFEGIEDPAKALAALQTVQDLDSGQLTTATKLEEMRTSITKAAEDKLAGMIKAKDDTIAALSGERDGLRTDLDRTVVGGAFAGSKFINDKLIIPHDIAQAYFGQHFSRGEKGELVAKDAQGAQIFSREDPSRPATFDEALEVIVNGYGRKDQILKGTGGTGGDSKPGAHGGNGKSIPRAEFMRLSPQDQMAKVRDGVVPVD